jgi:hypothetical protein
MPANAARLTREKRFDTWQQEESLVKAMVRRVHTIENRDVSL